MLPLLNELLTALEIAQQSVCAVHCTHISTSNELDAIAHCAECKGITTLIARAKAEMFGPTKRNCAYCAIELNNVTTGIVIIQGHNTRLTVCAPCAELAKHDNWIEVARQR